MIDQGGGASRTTDPAAGTSTGTDVSLREYVTARLDALDERTELRFQAMKEAVEKAEDATERRFESVNEFRAQLADQVATFVPREVIEPRVAAVEKWQAKIIGALILVTVVLPAGVAFVVYLLTRTAVPVSGL